MSTLTCPASYVILRPTASSTANPPPIHLRYATRYMEKQLRSRVKFRTQDSPSSYISTRIAIKTRTPERATGHLAYPDRANHPRRHDRLGTNSWPDHAPTPPATRAKGNGLQKAQHMAPPATVKAVRPAQLVPMTNSGNGRTGAAVSSRVRLLPPVACLGVYSNNRQKPHSHAKLQPDYVRNRQWKRCISARSVHHHNSPIHS